MSTVVSADGSTVLEIPAWCHGGSFAFVSTERPNVLTYVKLDQKTQQLIELFKAYGTNGKIVLPPEAAAVNGDVLERLAAVLPMEKRESAVAENLPEIPARPDCIVRLEFDDGCLAIHALSRPLKGNAELLLEPGFGPEKRQVEGKEGPYLLVRDLAAERTRFAPIHDALARFDLWFNGRTTWQIGDIGDAIAALDRLQTMAPKPVLEWNKDKLLKLSRPKVKITSTGRQRGWFDVKGTFTVDDGKVHDIIELLAALQANGGTGEYVRLTSGEYVFLTQTLRKQFEALAQAIKNADAKRTKLVKEFKANFRVAATGTPVENRLEELWSIFDFLDTGLLGTRESFLGRGVASVKPIVKPLILRRLKGEVLDDLPQKTEVTRFVELSVAERSAYEACRLKAQDDFATAEKKKRMGLLLAGLTRLRRFCCNPSLVLGKDIGSAKLEALAELMEELREGGHRALVFSQFTDYLAIVRKMIGEKGWSAQYLDGDQLQTLKQCDEAWIPFV